MNITIQLCGFVILVILYYFYRRQPSLGLRTVKTYAGALMMSLFSMELDIASNVLMHYSDVIPLYAIQLISRIYHVTIIWESFYILYYACAVIHNGKDYKRHVVAYIVPAVAGSVAAAVLPMQVFLKTGGSYTFGLGTQATYVAGLLFPVATIIETILARKRINPKAKSVLLVTMFVGIICTVIQLMHSNLYLVGFMVACTMMIMYFELENPEANIDKATGCFNSHALFEQLKESYLMGDKFSALMIYTESEVSSDESDALVDGTGHAIVAKLQKYKNAKVFHTVEHEFLLITPNVEILETVIEEVHAMMRDINNKNMDLGENVVNEKYILMPNGDFFNSSDEFLQAFRYFKEIESKRESGDVMKIDAEHANEFAERKLMEKLIQEAIEAGRVEVYYQPIYSVKSGTFTSAETLVRIKTEDGGVISPAKFIPVAEETGLILTLGNVILEECIKFISENDFEELGLHYIEVNLSVKQGESPYLATRAELLIGDYDIDPKYINFEITETASLQSRSALLNNMHKIIQSGSTFTLDDFGSGSSNLNYILDMPLKIIKLDFDMTQAYFTSDKAKSIVTHVIAMAHEMGIKVVSEGVETKEQLDEMVRIGTDYIQGYIFSKPLPKAEFLELIRENQQNRREMGPIEHAQREV